MKIRINLALLTLIAVVGTVSGDTPQPLKAELKNDRVVVNVGGQLFTEYLFVPEEKYPYFFPVLGPVSGQTVTIRRGAEYPHHSSVFFGCDRVNGGNYWQEGLDRGRIASKNVRLVQAAGAQVVIEQDCVWERPNAEAPFDDRRRIIVSAPSATLRYIDFEVTLTARIDVRIEKSNHSLFSARVAPDIAVRGGGHLVNAGGDTAEKGTFGKLSPWADYYGSRGSIVEGIAIFNHPQNRWSPPPWFTRDYGFMSPTPMQWLETGFLEIPKGDSLHLRYRVVIHTGDPAEAQLALRYEHWCQP